MTGLLLSLLVRTLSPFVMQFDSECYCIFTTVWLQMLLIFVAIDIAFFFVTFSTTFSLRMLLQ